MCEEGQVTPADLSRELGVEQIRIRDYLRSQYGTLPAGETRWCLSREQADDVRRYFRS